MFTNTKNLSGILKKKTAILGVFTKTAQDLNVLNLEIEEYQLKQQEIIDDCQLKLEAAKHEIQATESVKTENQAVVDKILAIVS